MKFEGNMGLAVIASLGRPEGRQLTRESDTERSSVHLYKESPPESRRPKVREYVYPLIDVNSPRELCPDLLWYLKGEIL